MDIHRHSSSGAHQVARRNLTLLADRYSSLSADLLAFRKEMRRSCVQPRFEILLSVSGLPTCRKIERADGGWIHDAHDPMASAAAAVRSLDLSEGVLVIVYRAGLGYVAGQVVRLYSGRTAQTRVIVHEDRWEIIWESLLRIDWSAVISNPSVYLCWGEKADEEVVRVLEEHPSLVGRGFCVIQGSNLDSKGEDRLKRLVSRINQIFSAAGERLRAIRRSVKPARRRTEENEMVILHGRAFEEFFPGFKHGLEQNGAQVEIVRRSRPISQFVASDISWLESCGCCPDVAASFNLSGFEPVELERMGRAGVRRVVWFYDDPRRFDLTAQDFSRMDLIFAFDPYHTSWLRSKTDVPVEHLRTATSFLKEPGISETPRSMSPPRVSFVGSSGLRRMAGFAQAMREVLAPLRSALEHLIRQWRGRDPARLYNQLESLPVKGTGLSRGTLLRLLEEYASMLLRLDYLEAAEPHGLVVFGDPGWASTAIPGTVPGSYAGWAPDYWTETPWIYRNSLINLNIFHVQCIDSPTVRVYDILACGGFLLTEYRPSIEEEFSVGLDLETFRTPEELQDKIIYYLNHPHQRERIASNGQKTVLENYTYIQRGRVFLERVRSLL